MNNRKCSLKKEEIIIKRENKIREKKIKYMLKGKKSLKRRN